MKTTVKALLDLYVKLGGSLTDTYSTIANGAAVGSYTLIPDCIEACTQKAGSGGGGGGGDASIPVLGVSSSKLVDAEGNEVTEEQLIEWLSGGIFPVIIDNRYLYSILMFSIDNEGTTLERVLWESVGQSGGGTSIYVNELEWSYGNMYSYTYNIAIPTDYSGYLSGTTVEVYGELYVSDVKDGIRIKVSNGTKSFFVVTVDSVSFDSLTSNYTISAHSGATAYTQTGLAGDTLELEPVSQSQP